MSLITWIKNLLNKAQTLIEKVRGLIDDVFSSEIAKLLGEIYEITSFIVKKMKDSNLSSEEKRKAAFKTVKEYVALKELNIDDSLINLFIELVYQRIKKAS